MLQRAVEAVATMRFGGIPGSLERSRLAVCGEFRSRRQSRRQERAGLLDVLTFQPFRSLEDVQCLAVGLLIVVC